MRLVETYKVSPVTRKQGLESLNRHIAQLAQSGVVVHQIITLEWEDLGMIGTRQDGTPQRLTAYFFVDYSNEITALTYDQELEAQGGP